MPNESIQPTALQLNPGTTALVLIDLQRHIVSMPTAPYPAARVIANAAALAARCRALEIPVVLVTVGFRPDARDRLSSPTDSPMMAAAGLSADGMALAPELQAASGDIFVTKRQWGAFYGTDLDLQLRRRGVDTLLLGGIATNFGVESTARDAWERNYRVVFVEDAMSSRAAEAHAFAVSVIFPRIGRVRSFAQVMDALGQIRLADNTIR